MQYSRSGRRLSRALRKDFPRGRRVRGANRGGKWWVSHGAKRAATRCRCFGDSRNAPPGEKFRASPTLRGRCLYRSRIGGYRLKSSPLSSNVTVYKMLIQRNTHTKTAPSARFFLPVSLPPSTTRPRSEDWPGFRGPRKTAFVARKTCPPIGTLPMPRGRRPCPAQGHASPIVWGDRIVTGHGAAGNSSIAFCCAWTAARAKSCGRRRRYTGRWKRSTPNSYASGTPVTDGKRVYAMFMSGNDIMVVAHNLADGKQIWSVRAGTHDGPWGDRQLARFVQGQGHPQRRQQGRFVF